MVLNYWLSVFFAWIPALIFYFVGKDKGNQRAHEFNVANLNFSLLRTGAALAATILGYLPVIGGLIAVLLGIAGFVLFIFHIIAAAKVSADYRSNAKTDPFIFNVPMVK